ncbi:hypothetical protein [uncultured Chryseobacterium sp.]|uniref:hypothetical protein n=1 Tax=uncultured Chryseobacterium sp. TaxID=259322 RepID=UPI0025DEFC20|nr:hypothetical protein [uncultured Chryseobacterium sp.]
MGSITVLGVPTTTDVILHKDIFNKNYLKIVKKKESQTFTHLENLREAWVERYERAIIVGQSVLFCGTG